MSAQAPAIARDTEETAFSHILGDFVKRVPGAVAASLVDNEGECVDYVIQTPTRHSRFEITPFDIKVAAAHWAIVRAEIAQQNGVGRLRMIVLRSDNRSFVVRQLPEEYTLVVVLRKRAGFVAVARALDACERALAAEAAWKLEKGRGIWIAVDVETDERERPTWLTIGSLSCAVEVLGGLTGLARRERGYRVRLPSGGELNLVREVGNRWYADENLA